MKKSTLILAIAFISMMGLKAQQRPVFSQYMFNGMAINPAYAGVHETIHGIASYRDQWINMDGAPKTLSFAVDSKLSKKNIGLGLMITNDRVGIHSDIGVYAAYSYKVKTMGGTLSMGLQAGFNNLNSDYTRLTLDDISDPNLQGVNNSFNPNFGVGAYWHNNSTYVGLSVPYILHNNTFDKNDISTVTESIERRYYFLTGGHVFPVSQNLLIRPSVLLRVQEGAPVGTDINLNFVLYGRLNLGTSYRTGRSLVTFFQIQATREWSFGYAYDYVFSDLNQFNRGSHEFIIQYGVNIDNSHKSMPCPSYFLR
ncbi:type IX secretion system membrane protein PorP/SprF [Mangrovivirga sp. M17]|uniref:Type IX secretion system membrane protein PorP/SprF n=1 Tax=Mangrovivirga halotolerans TaxID=2993936 RepID=A0ABT3RKD8_9BACT|nr:type IX secretion system membrane protein PorP/SprF [Mangrovivirga halotolerans]MCX2742274.1 type IX secretion system membrane protein PorP/SprF [Mangrovivirga halotolerans]